MDLLPTVAELADAPLPDDRPIDGEDVRALLRAPETASSPHDVHAYYDAEGSLAAVRDAEGWKLHLDRDELYYLPEDVGERDDVFDENPAVVDRLRSAADRVAADVARRSRPAGSVAGD
jgi:arylsulfatase A-like enzyme